MSNTVTVRFWTLVEDLGDGSSATRYFTSEVLAEKYKTDAGEYDYMISAPSECVLEVEASTSQIIGSNKGFDPVHWSIVEDGEASNDPSN